MFKTKDAYERLKLTRTGAVKKRGRTDLILTLELTLYLIGFSIDLFLQLRYSNEHCTQTYVRVGSSK